MKRSLLTLVLLFTLLLPAAATAQTPSGPERITDFHSEIQIDENGTMRVTETIRVVALGGQIRRGIYRDFPTRYTDTFGFTQRTGFSITGIRRDGKAEPYHTENLQNGVRVYIGEEDVFLNPGVYTYTINYETDRQLGFFEDHDELYYNITGNGWSFSIEESSANIYFPTHFKPEDLNAYAYTGASGERGEDYSVEVTESNNRPVVRYKSTRPLSPGEGLTVVIEWDKGLIESPSAAEQAVNFLLDNGLLICGLCFTALFILFCLLTWLIKGRDPETGVIVPLFSPPDNLSPAEVGLPGPAWAWVMTGRS
ncbi:MAG: hypothetical protein TR69_WS6001000238 [candidate division WS6 bacterium OLB20]|uniref:DUF2207 domain-containing protein n=1 Tax=candidate division WS6 bacterium OLB20 TaxID=1617426 RepID=A0A136M0E0_9BACT|nr:MAG: hypothetical protein TR69_WS6001000238 [candidate division WS6 bacterium OLB20]